MPPCGACLGRAGILRDEQNFLPVAPLYAKVPFVSAAFFRFFSVVDTPPLILSFFVPHDRNPGWRGSTIPVLTVEAKES